MKIFRFVLCLIVLAGMATAQTATPVLTSATPLNQFYMFAPNNAPSATFDASKRVKTWAAPKGYNFAAHGVTTMNLEGADVLIFPLSWAADPAGKTAGTVTNSFAVPAADVYTYNIPPAQTIPGIAAAPTLPTLPVPVDQALWDPVNYYLVAGTMPMDAMKYVRDHRSDAALPAPGGFTTADRLALQQAAALAQQAVALLQALQVAR